MEYSAKSFLSLVVVLLSALGSLPVGAAGTAKGQLQIEVANDAPFQTDRDYTGGLHLAWRPANSPFTLHLGQDIYTPEDLTTTTPVDGEHPYGGWTYLGVNYLYQISSNWRADVTLDIGSTGPRSGARVMQEWIHRATGSTFPKGWQSQVHNEWGFMPELKLDYKLPLSAFQKGGLVYRVVPYLRWRSGNIIRDHGVGVRLMLGSQLPAFSNVATQPDGDFYWFFRVGLEYTAVARNILLEGNSKVRNGVKQYSYGVIPEKALAVANLGVFWGFDSYEAGVKIQYNSKAYASQGHMNSSFLIGGTPSGNFVMSVIFKKFF
ncbi:lipid A deacylase LpxR family protein [Microbulbifer spongiae]|uniref:Lipid A deacylase LpxR family protein n=1 Tax=Microbulbifer spongiae TaxID=2944933 RepID=A0ABY9EHL4_9GAMM|nr:lipid A deacylase LpxR family protein [Microbulbifer sp. MI-G]WKD51349.1 lipid A deacylase LpxR family protein [Microbulbifer sp. MI-G]